MSAIIIAGEVIHYEVLGRGRPVIFLHSWVGSWRYWIPCMQSASISFRAYALDLWGYGDTAKTAANYSLGQQVMLVEQFLEKLGIGKVALVGHGLGGIVAMLAASRHPDAIDRMMVIAVPLAAETINPRLMTGSPAELADWLLGQDPASEAARGEACKADAQATRTALAQLPQPSLRNLNSHLATPCLCVHGQNDPVVEPPRPESLPGLPDQTHFILLEQSGHYPMLDETSKFNRLLADFLELGCGESPRQLQVKEEWKRRVR
jgi:pimeloyl-ACP methyl ester carboxylesterase